MRNDLLPSLLTQFPTLLLRCEILMIPAKTGLTLKVITPKIDGLGIYSAITSCN